MSNDATRKKIGRPPGKRRESISLTLPIDLLAKARREAADQNLSLSTYIELAISRRCRP